MRTFRLLLYFFVFLALGACNRKQQADLLIYNGKIYTVNSGFTVAEAMAVRDGHILATGTTEDLQRRYDATTQTDLQGRFVYPGFIDAHSHFYAYATLPLQADFTGTHSFDEVISRLVAFQKGNAFGWILGRGWDQNDWSVKEFPTRTRLDSLFPKTPVFLNRIDGHAVLCNKVALDLAGITAQTKVPGGEILLHNGEPSGVLIDNAVDLVQPHIPSFSESILRKALKDAEARCFAVGLTTVTDAGIGKDSILLIDRLQREGLLSMRVVAMLSDVDSTLDYFFKTGPLKTPRLNVRSVKLYGDGALGSRGACLLEPYADAPGRLGFLLRDTAHMQALARRAAAYGFQMCTHCIGDSAVRTVLQIYAAVLGGPNDKRWRIEHCQVVHPSDLATFGRYSILPSVQPTHATSDMYWAGERLGPVRLRSAYAYHDLQQAAGHLAFGTDFPVENINPLYTFYAAVSRRDLQGFPPEGFLRDNAVGRKDALRSMTIEAAYAAFEEKEKGSLEPGKLADFVILDTDLLEAKEDDLPKARTWATYIGGIAVYKK